MSTPPSLPYRTPHEGSSSTTAFASHESLGQVQVPGVGEVTAELRLDRPFHREVDRNAASVRPAEGLVPWCCAARCGRRSGGVRARASRVQSANICRRRGGGSRGPAWPSVRTRGSPSTSARPGTAGSETMSAREVQLCCLAPTTTSAIFGGCCAFIATDRPPIARLRAPAPARRNCRAHRWPPRTRAPW